MSGMMSETPSRARLAIIGHVVHLVNRDYEAMARDYYGTKPKPEVKPEVKPGHECEPIQSWGGLSSARLFGTFRGRYAHRPGPPRIL